MDAYIRDFFDIERQLPGSYEVEAIIDGPFVTKTSLEDLVKNFRHVRRVYQEKKIKNEKGNIVYRERNPGISECKSKLFSKINREYWVKLSLSSEVPSLAPKDLMRDAIEYTITRYTIEHKNCIVEVGFNITSSSIWLEVEKQEHSTQGNFLECITDIISILQGGRFIKRFEYETIQKMLPQKYAKPVTLTKENIRRLNQCKYISRKYDGVRKFVIIDSGRIYAIDLKKNVSYLRDIDEEKSTILDCELVDDVLYIIDVVIFRGQDVREESSQKRLGYRHNFENDLLSVKEFVPFTNPNQILEMYNEEGDVPIDGIILLGNKYNSVIKWKPQNTVDMFVSEDGGLYGYGDVFISTKSKGLVQESINEVCEFKYNIEDESYEFIRIRQDKPNPNSLRIIEANKNVPMLESKECILMRTYHNFIKRSILEDVKKGSTLVDIGTGQFGDVSKWSKFKKIYCIEPRSDEKWKKRITRSAHKITLLNYGISQYKIFRDQLENNIDLFTAFFCMNLFGDKDMLGLRKMLKEKSGEKSKFICICITNLKVSSNDCYTTRIIDDTFYGITLHGTRIVSLKERVLDKNMLSSFLESCGYTLYKSQVLNDINHIMSNEERQLSSMYEMMEFRNF